MTLAQARAAICRAGIDDSGLRAACAVLRRDGYWMDLQRADLLLALLADPATAPEPVFGPARDLYEVTVRLDWADVLGALAVCALLVAGLWVAFGAGLPTGGAELMAKP